MKEPALPRRDFKQPKLWYFIGDEFYTRTTPPHAGIEAQRRKQVGVVAVNFDRAYTLFREKHPEVRIVAVNMANESVDYIVDEPAVYRVIDRLLGGGK